MAQLYVFDSFVLFVGHFFDNKMHTHHAVQLSIAIDHEMNLETEEGQVNGNIFLVNADFFHKINFNEGRLLLFFFESETTLAKMLKKQYLGTKINIRLENSTFVNHLRVLTESLSPNTIIGFVQTIFSYLNLKIKNIENMDSRIVKVSELIEKTPGKIIKINKIAEEVFLSVSRLQHIFKQEVGISIKRFLLWKRLKDAVQYLQQTNDLTRTAYQTGFSDSAHLSRTFKNMFGVKLKEIFKKSSSVQVYFCRL